MMMPIKSKALLIRRCKGVIDQDCSELALIFLLRSLVPPMTPARWTVKKGRMGRDLSAIVSRMYGPKSIPPTVLTFYQFVPLIFAYYLSLPPLINDYLD
jgi:hypothetical protein